MFVLYQSGKVFSQVFFKKLAGLGGAHKNGAFFLPSFFFAPLVPKKKRDYKIRLFFRRGRKLLERSFPFPTPLSFKNFETWGKYFFVVMPALDGCFVSS